ISTPASRLSLQPARTLNIWAYRPNKLSWEEAYRVVQYATASFTAIKMSSSLAAETPLLKRRYIYLGCAVASQWYTGAIPSVPNLSWWIDVLGRMLQVR